MASCSFTTPSNVSEQVITEEPDSYNASTSPTTSTHSNTFELSTTGSNPSHGMFIEFLAKVWLFFKSKPVWQKLTSHNRPSPPPHECPCTSWCGSCHSSDQQLEARRWAPPKLEYARHETRNAHVIHHDSYTWSGFHRERPPWHTACEVLIAAAISEWSPETLSQLPRFVLVDW